MDMNGFQKLGVAAFCVWLLSGCITSATPLAAPVFEEGDLVLAGAGPGTASNVERFEAFLAVTESGGEDAVRLVNMSTEGNPIYTDIEYTEGTYVIYVDTTEDVYAAEEDRKREKAAECPKLISFDLSNEYREFHCGSYDFRVQDAE